MAKQFSPNSCLLHGSAGSVGPPLQDVAPIPDQVLLATCTEYEPRFRGLKQDLGSPKAVVEERMAARAQPRIHKVIFDAALSVPLLIIFILPMILVAASIKLDSSGPVFFRQPRVGLNGKLFTIWKFRTMRADETDIDGARLTARDDPRVTRVGAWLRRWSVDELPQLFNVLTGTMSLVGPRPHAIQANVGDRLYSEIVPGYSLRQTVKPGITGWAQVNGCRGETTTLRQIEQRIAYDLDYIRRQSLLLDIRILFQTLVHIADRNAF